LCAVQQGWYREFRLVPSGAGRFFIETKGEIAVKIAVVGATGEVGRMMTRVLQEQNVRPEEVSFFASARSAGDEVEFYGGNTG
jgi:predicted amino acid dehydrogenase